MGMSPLLAPRVAGLVYCGENVTGKTLFRLPFLSYLLLFLFNLKLIYYILYSFLILLRLLLAFIQSFDFLFLGHMTHNGQG